MLPESLLNKISGIGIECESIGLQAQVVYKDIDDLIRMALRKIYYVEGQELATFCATTIDGVAACTVDYAKYEEQATYTYRENDITYMYENPSCITTKHLDFGTVGNATTAIADAMNELQSNIKMALYLPEEQFNQLNNSTYSKVSGIALESDIKESNAIIKLLNGGNIFCNNSLDDGTGLLCPFKRTEKYLKDGWTCKLTAI